MYRKIVAFLTVENQFFTYVLVIIGIYIAQTLFKISATRKDGTFDWNKLLNGLIDYAIYFLGIIVVFFSGQLVPDAEIIPIGEKTLTINDALIAIAYTLMVAQSIKCFKNIRDTFKVTDEKIIEVNDPEAKIVGEDG